MVCNCARALVGILALGSWIAAVAAQVPADSQSASVGFGEADLARLTAEIQRDVETLTGRKFKHAVKTAFYSPEQLQAFLRGGLAAGQDGAGPETPEDAIGRMLGLLPEGFDPAAFFENAMGAFVPGIYDHETKTLGIVRREPADYSTLYTRSVIAHELVHALDDQHYDLTALLEADESSDAQFAVGAVIEGSAVTIQNRYEQLARRGSEDDTAGFNQARMREMQQMRTLFDAPPIVASFLARFPSGVRFLAREDPGAMAAVAGVAPADDGLAHRLNSAVRTALAAMPRSGEQVLHPGKYWNASERDEPVRVDEKRVESLFSEIGLRTVARETVGELLCAILTSPEDKRFNPMMMPMPGYWTNEAATGWGGDRFFLLEPEQTGERANERCGAWFTLWDSPADCRQFVEAYVTHRPSESRSLVRLGDCGAVFLFRFEAEQRAQVTRRLLADRPACTKDGRPWAFDRAGQPG